MQRIHALTSDLTKKLLHFLYQDELYNIYLIDLLENRPEFIGELYIHQKEKQIMAVMHMKSDGNSDYTTFSYMPSEDGLPHTAAQIRSLCHEKILLAGKRSDVIKLLELLGSAREVAPNQKFEGGDTK
ncbi:hypothetical protein [Paenibacillus apiarius]|uniref:Uncharacterized protein n=1 Tax=Paenibacillus apiarius TaxID=46240 RepID=A0ABT4DVX6_9BACL|nr:hypothetical protein [Paenibacillus apiarius]MCY9513142.1 hypothetical protein [Paenibacillus apiarius]MCY9521500.1 hypothetical protein [Paenibacillus apiarius]MCY9551655.1 hypothetical protein [Paenibacillus apiarius]MCY9560558.1 hypothetical protein [Paenibacillus apiarius]MCY9685192.1 hypothetical protein [Paenibacillus apiarius]